MPGQPLLRSIVEGNAADFRMPLEIPSPDVIVGPVQREVEESRGQQVTKYPDAQR